MGHWLWSEKLFSIVTIFYFSKYLLINSLECSWEIKLSFLPWRINTGQCISPIASILSYFSLIISFPKGPTCSWANYFKLLKGLISTKALGLRGFSSALFLNNSKATPVPIDRPITIIFSSWKPRSLIQKS